MLRDQLFVAATTCLPCHWRNRFYHHHHHNWYKYKFHLKKCVMDCVRASTCGRLAESWNWDIKLALALLKIKGVAGSFRFRQQGGGRWPWKWKLESAKECVTTHLPNELALKMDGAEANCSGQVPNPGE
jgi:hypothetical protein